MAAVKFDVVKRSSNNFITTIRAVTENPRRVMNLYLETDTGNIIYPVTIEQIVPGITINLDTEDSASCSFPPCIPESMVDGLRAYLGTVHEVIATARKLIKVEQEKLKKESVHNDDGSLADSRNTLDVSVESWEIEYWKIAEDMKKCVEIIRCGRSDIEKQAAVSILKRHLERCRDDVNLSDLTAIYKGLRENNAIGYDLPAVAQFVGRMANRYPKPKAI